MEITRNEISIRGAVKDYIDNQENGVTGFGGRLNIRPAFQREFIYKDDQRDAVIHSVMKGLPLGTMYWVSNPDNDELEVLDGQQRLISICQYITGLFSVDYKFFYNLDHEEQEEFYDYLLDVYFCEGTVSEKLEWFTTINIAGAILTKQELMNINYTGSWLYDAKRFFSMTGCPAYNIGSGYIRGVPIRQGYLETALKWISDGHIEDYMSEHQGDVNANELSLYFKSVIGWVETVFPTYYKEMKGLPWGILYNEHKDDCVDTEMNIKKVDTLMIDDDVTSKPGIFKYLLTGKEKFLNIRAFTPTQKREKYSEQRGLCPVCGGFFEIDGMEGDHTIPWCEGGTTDKNNLTMLCKTCNREKGSK